jgi:cyclopropane fatty-acyl-phospholipid synthase-like methyltransferase
VEFAVMNLFRTIRHNLASRRARERRRARWDEKWGGEGFSPVWLERNIPAELREVYETARLDETMTVLDVGCGQGAITRWFAEKGSIAVGVDLAESAIRAARERHEDGSCRLRFLAADFCREFLPYEGSFRIVVDRGCFHGVPVYDQNAYVRTLAAVTQEGSDYFLFVRAFRGPQPGDRTAEREAKTTEIESLFQRYFLIEQSHDTTMGEWDGRELSGLFFRMRRNGRKR